MVTLAQARERAEHWVNGGVPAYQHREVQVQEFDLGYVVWAQDRADVPTSDGGAARLVIARDSGATTLWPALPPEEVMRRYEESYGAGAAAAPAPEPPKRVDLESTSFLLSPPDWLQEAADRMGVPDNRSGSRTPAGSATPPGADSGTGADSAAGTGGWGSGPVLSTPPPASWSSPSSGAVSWADTSDSGSGPSVAPPATVFAPPISGSDQDEEENGETGDGRYSTEARTQLLPDGSGLAATRLSPAYTRSDAPPQPSQPAPQAPPVESPQAARTPVPADSGEPPAGSGASGGGAGGVHHAATMLADPGMVADGTPPPAPSATSGAADMADIPTSGAPRPAPPAPGRTARPARGAGGRSVPPPPGAPGTPGARPGGGGAGSAAGGPPGKAYEPTQLVSADEVASQGGQDLQPGQGAVPPPADPSSGGSGGVHHAATMLADPGTTGGPQPPSPPNSPGAPGGSGGVHHAATMLAGPTGPTGPPQTHGQHVQPGPPVQHVQHGHSGHHPQAPPQGGYQPQAGQPLVGPGYMAVLTYRAPDGSEQKLIRRAAPGLPHPEWQIMQELRGMNIPPEQVLELHTELECCDLPGGYCARMVKEAWPQVRISHTAPYGRDHASRQQGMRHLVEHQGELHQVADAPARHAPVRAALMPVQQAPPIPLEGIGHELGQAFGQGMFRFDQMAVSRQGVPDVVAQTLMWSGLPLEVPPFFWAQAQPGRPIPTLAELAQERGVQPGSDAGSYLVMGNDYGRQLCVQYGTAHIVAVPLEGAPDGQPATPQFVNTGLPEFARSLAMLGRMWPLRYGLTPDQAGRWTVDFQQQLAALDPAALGSTETWWSVILEQLWDGLL
ncbi:SUKH-4 family immunity protein [Streptomyces sp. P38-E01]|uniref:SUKH-4 family immunity protein n=1 Tax=Streptomyces tardus TaxID=2780544 RepID=A0A949JEJ5_9ACTN|nr:SUKH-4 family immunity protein [Streptomyces tardus]MBU7598511.1 SUKH-4 family immunity protein [Streptomyces tardus]